ncbi:hypothetical protein [Streptomyces sp. GC420]|uniref:hypothetical protein n=1 Tax=Streptomyces sp. GC420 TaxID=2697568 RepID=UPI0014152526|nr:hypothetical protein [Streptomyces sp. GC420]NBM14915.1 hypothetical protein [Streptomyces sp. GC420]
MGWTVLYIAFGVVALWLLGEVLLQYKARLRWRLLAFAGFLGVVIGVLLPSVIVIGVGAAAFAVGQTYVTLSFRKGFQQGWALNGMRGGSSRRRKDQAASREPTLEVSDLAYETPESETPGYDLPDYERSPFEPAQFGAAGGDEGQDAPVYAPQPLPEEDTGQYGVYGGDNDSVFAAAAPQSPDGYAAQGTDAYGYNYSGYDEQQQMPQQQYDYGAQQQYAAYSDPYIGTTQQQYDAYGQYGTGGYDAYGGQYAADTPAGGVWVPQQRDGEQQPQDQGQQPYPPYQQGYDPDFNEQQRY